MSVNPRLTVTYDPYLGQAVPDGAAAGMARALVKMSKSTPQACCVSSTVVIDAVRLALKRKEIAPAEVAIFFKGERLPFDAEGRLAQWPKGFCDHGEAILWELLG